jgi:DNA mismatch repair protein MutS
MRDSPSGSYSIVLAVFRIDRKPFPMTDGERLTPMMKQFREAKAAHPGMLVLFRNGDFYELFESDAELGHRVLGLTLTKRDREIPMAGFPYHKLEHYLGLLLRAGHRVAVCEQLEEAQAGKKLIRREVNRVVTPGTVTEDELLDPRTPNFVAAICRGSQGRVGAAWVDCSSGMFAATDTLQDGDELSRIQPVELLVPDRDGDFFASRLNRRATCRPDWTFDAVTAKETLHEHFRVSTMAGFGFADDQPCLQAAGALIQYLRETMKAPLGHLARLVPYRAERTLILDEVTRRSLELTRTLRDGSRNGSLLAAVDRTVTPMGARLLQDQLLAPLKDKSAIESRHEAVQELSRDHAFRGDVRKLFDETADLYRLTARAATARATPKDLAAVNRTLGLLPRFKTRLAGRRSGILRQLDHSLDLCPELHAELCAALADDPPYQVKDGGAIRSGFHDGLDRLRQLATDGKAWMAKYQAEQIEASGIPSLKVAFTAAIGYYIEITNTHEHRVPPHYLHERTLKGAKRYTTPELREYQEQVLTAEERARGLEIELFGQLRDRVAAAAPRLIAAADALAMLDFLAGLAELAVTRNYVRPTMSDEPVLDIRDGRHPVLDQSLDAGQFVPNDARFGGEPGMFWLITGPNMSGKSTFIRQVALITLLAHVGSFVPASSAVVGLTDRIFTRVGASDELSRGQSTFMVEMTEAANILNNATPASLVILDEIGRGTSTYDGVSLAWAIAEHLHSEVGCRTLFATHYHELADLAESLPQLRNYNVEVREAGGEVVFLHKIAPGRADQSYGIHVAKLAGVPESVLARAAIVLNGLERRHQQPPPAPAKPLDARKKKTAPSVPTLFGD